MSQKEFKTYRQLLSILRSRGMTIEKGSQVIRILEQERVIQLNQNITIVENKSIEAKTAAYLRELLAEKDAQMSSASPLGSV